MHFQPNNDAGSRVQGLKLTPFIGDGNVSLMADSSSIFIKFKTNPVYRGRKLILSSDILLFSMFKTNPVYRGRKQADSILKYMESANLKLTPFIGDGNYYKRAKV